MRFPDKRDRRVQLMLFVHSASTLIEGINADSWLEELRMEMNLPPCVSEHLNLPEKLKAILQERKSHILVCGDCRFNRLALRIAWPKELPPPPRSLQRLINSAKDSGIEVTLDPC